MEFKIYNPEEDDYLYDDFEEVLERPEGVGKYREAIGQALEDAEEVVGMDSDVEIVFGLADPEKIMDKWDTGPDSHFHIYGFTFGSHFEGRERDFIFLYANDSPENWEGALKNMTVHERSHIEFYDCHSDEVLAERLEGSMYNSVLFEGHSTNTAALLNEVKDYGWDPDYRSLGNDVDHERLMEELQKDRTESGFFDHGGEEWTEAEGYPISFEIFNWVIENRNVGVEELPSISEEEARELINEAAEQLYR